MRRDIIHGRFSRSRIKDLRVSSVPRLPSGPRRQEFRESDKADRPYRRQREEWQKLISAWQKELAEKRCFGHKELIERLNELSAGLRQKETSPQETAYLLSALLLEFHQRSQAIYSSLEPLDIAGQTMLAETVNFGDTLLYYRAKTHYGYLYHDKSGCHRAELPPQAAAAVPV